MHEHGEGQTRYDMNLFANNIAQLLALISDNPISASSKVLWEC